MNDFGLYLIITKPVLTPTRVAEICVERGVKMLQVREKNMCDRELIALCRTLVSITRGSDTKLIVNDRPDIAALSDADGVHLGQDDMSIQDARQILGQGKIIGLSTHSLAQAVTAIGRQPDYIGFGPVYPTPTKAIADPTVGVDLLRQVVASSPVPVVAIGGIDFGNLDTVLDAGAKNVCAVRYFMESIDLAERISIFQNALSADALAAL